MSHLPLIKAKKMEKLLFTLGFNKIRQKGSHVFYKHTDKRTTTIPHHVGKVLARPLIKKILQDIELSVDEYNRIIQDI